jgi:hypothetical protein
MQFRQEELCISSATAFRASVELRADALQVVAPKIDPDLSFLRILSAARYEPP